MLTLFQTLHAHLATQLPDLAELDRFNNQIALDGTGVMLTFPALFYQLDGMKMTTISRGIQHGEGILRLRHCIRHLRPNADAYALEARSYQALQEFKGGPILTGLDRIALYPDPNHAALEIVISEYHIKYTDPTLYLARHQPTSPAQAGITGQVAVALALN